MADVTPELAADAFVGLINIVCLVLVLRQIIRCIIEWRR